MNYFYSSIGIKLIAVYNLFEEKSLMFDVLHMFCKGHTYLKNWPFNLKFDKHVYFDPLNIFCFLFGLFKIVHSLRW